MEETAIFEFFVRKLPPNRNFLVAAGLEQVLAYLQQLHITADEIEWLAGTRLFNEKFLAKLAAGLKFTGDVHAMPEGTIFFPNEPILRITAPLPEAQLVESRVINLLHFQTLIASKAIRSVLTAPDKLLVDFGMRRAHGAEAALLAARASYLVGFSGSATAAAGQAFNIPVYGTMAHSFVQAHTNETEAFLHFAQANPDNVVLLIDTYDTEAAAHKVVELAPRLAAQGIRIKGVRLDSGDLNDHAHKVRALLDRGGLNEVTIFASGNIDEYVLEQLKEQQAPIDGFGVGTHMDTSADAPYLDCAYKLQEYAGIPRRKRSEGKVTWPGRKQVYRCYGDDGILAGDTITLADAPHQGQPLLELVMQNGQPLSPVTLEEAREYSRRLRSMLPALLHRLQKAEAYPVMISEELRSLARSMDGKA
jgi:nicotinate phosphoribosyltransferase